jgi:hypothetical protein
MEIDTNKIIERLAIQNTQQCIQVASLQIQLETVIEAYNKLVGGESGSTAPKSRAESVTPDDIFSPPVAAE